MNSRNPEGTTGLLRELEGAIALAYQRTVADSRTEVAAAFMEKVAMGQLSFRADASAEGVVVSIADTDRAERQLPMGAVPLSKEGSLSLESFIARTLGATERGAGPSERATSALDRLFVRFDQRTMNLAVFRQRPGGEEEPLWNTYLPRSVSPN